MRYKFRNIYIYLFSSFFFTYANFFYAKYMVIINVSILYRKPERYKTSWQDDYAIWEDTLPGYSNGFYSQLPRLFDAFESIIDNNMKYIFRNIFEDGRIPKGNIFSVSDFISPGNVSSPPLSRKYSSGGKTCFFIYFCL